MSLDEPTLPVHIGKTTCPSCGGEAVTLKMPWPGHARAMLACRSAFCDYEAEVVIDEAPARSDD